MQQEKIGTQPKLNFKKIPIQQLEERPQINTKEVDKKQLFQAMNWKFNWVGKPCMIYQDSGLGQQRILQRNGVFRNSSFFDAFLNAYTQHGDVALVPDQIWIMIIFYVSKYISEKAQMLRSKFVAHQGIQILTVKQQVVVQNQQQCSEKQKNWDYFFDQIIKQIQKNTVPGAIQNFTCDFSTTNKLYRTISTAITMNTLKKFFQYHRRFCVCGINNVYMAGQRSDWSKMIQKLQNLIKYDVDGQLKKYIEHMKIILCNFLKTYDGSPDLQFWNTIMQSYQKKQVYGGNATKVDGWILHFFGKYQQSQINGFPELAIKVPIKLINQLNNTQKQLLLVSDWVSISKLNERTYKPDVGLCIVEANGSK